MSRILTLIFLDKIRDPLVLSGFIFFSPFGKSRSIFVKMALKKDLRVNALVPGHLNDYI